MFLKKLWYSVLISCLFYSMCQASFSRPQRISAAAAALYFGYDTMVRPSKLSAKEAVFSSLSGISCLLNTFVAFNYLPENRPIVRIVFLVTSWISIFKSIVVNREFWQDQSPSVYRLIRSLAERYMIFVYYYFLRVMHYRCHTIATYKIFSSRFLQLLINVMILNSVYESSVYLQRKIQHLLFPMTEICGYIQSLLPVVAFSTMFISDYHKNAFSAAYLATISLSEGVHSIFSPIDRQIHMVRCFILWSFAMVYSPKALKYNMPLASSIPIPNKGILIF